jgi:hypothetical protein
MKYRYTVINGSSQSKIAASQISTNPLIYNQQMIPKVINGTVQTFILPLCWNPKGNNTEKLLACVFQC